MSDYLELTKELARLEKAEQDIQEEVSSLYNSSTAGLGPLLESRAERLSEELGKIRASITDVKLKIVKFREEAANADKDLTRLA
jgi:uncharacterized protein (UPF0335 family)